MFKKIICLSLLLCTSYTNAETPVRDAVSSDYNEYLKPLFIHFHENPELSMGEVETAKRLAMEFTSLGFEVHEGIGETGVVAIFKNGDGPTVMMRGDMDGLPVKEDSGVAYPSKAEQRDPITGEVRPVMHACGHDVHITGLVGTARYMTSHLDQWSGTLMLIGQPAEERIMGARRMIEDGLWDTFEKPDYALALHVFAGLEVGKVDVRSGPISAGSTSVDIIVHGEGTHGAYPQGGKDPIVLGSQIVMALQTLVSREIGPKEPAVITVGAFNSGLKHNVISDRAHLKITTRYTSPDTKETILQGIKRISENMGRVAGLPEDKLPEVIVSKEEDTPPQINDDNLTDTLQKVWIGQYGEEHVVSVPDEGMGAEDFPFFVTGFDIPSVYWAVGGTSTEDMQALERGEYKVPSHHSPFFKVEPESVAYAVDSTVSALLHLMPKN